MKGSIEVQTLVYLALGILLFATLAYILLKYTPLGSKTIFSMIDDWMNFQSPEEKTLLKAMSCAYYRCIDGCGSSKVKVSWEDESGEKVSCLDDFCKDEWRDGEGKICGEVAKENPVKVYLDSDITVTDQHWGIFFKKDAVQVQWFIAKKSCESYGLYAAVNPTKAIVVPEEAECEDANSPGIPWDRVNNCKLPEGYYNIWSGKAGLWDAEDIIICSAE